MGSCGECRTRCTAVDALATCSRTPPPPRYDYPAVGQSTPRSPLDSVVITALTSGPAAPAVPRDNSPAHEFVRNFVRDIVQGITVSIPAFLEGPAAHAVDGVVSLDRRLKVLSLQRCPKAEPIKRRSVALDQIESVVYGSYHLGEDSSHATERCVTLFLEEGLGPALVMEFSTVEERDRFAFCLCMFVDGRKVEADRRSL